MKKSNLRRVNVFIYVAVLMIVCIAFYQNWNQNKEQRTTASAISESTGKSAEQQILKTVLNAEENFYRPFEYTKQVTIKGKKVRVFTEPFSTSDAIYKHYRKTFDDRMADELSSQAVDWSLSKEGKGLVANPHFETFNVLFLSDTQLKVAKADDKKAVVEAFVDDDKGKQHKIEYSLVRDFANNWVIEKKTVR